MLLSGPRGCYLRGKFNWLPLQRRFANGFIQNKSLLCNATLHITGSNRYMSTQSTIPHVTNESHQHAFKNLDIKYIVANTEKLRANAAVRRVHVDFDKILELNSVLQKLGEKDNALRQERNNNAREIKEEVKVSNGKDTVTRQTLVNKGKVIREELQLLDSDLRRVEHELAIEAGKVPNDTHAQVPLGGEGSERVIKYVGKEQIEEQSGRSMRDHVQICDLLDLADFEGITAGSRVSGTKFVYFKNEAALLELALAQWTMGQLVQLGYTPVVTPDVVRPIYTEGCGFQPRGEGAQVYHIEDHDLCLAGTSEVPLASWYGNTKIPKDKLPLKLVGYSHCFRAEAGRGLRDKGLYRLHQFSKVEMFAFTQPHDSEQIHHEMLNIEEDLYSQLGFPFRVVDMASEDLGAPAYRKFDIEAWMPSRCSYGEISSTSNCTSYQARRLNIRYALGKDGISSDYVHTVNGTAVAVPRVLLAILENGQQEDGSVIIPEVLRPFMNGQTHILPKHDKWDPEHQHGAWYA